MPPLLEVRNLSKTYKRSAKFVSSGYRQSLGPINFTLERGKTLSIIGESGSGKSSLAKIIAGLIPSTGGEILVNGNPVSKMSRQKRCQAIRMIFQDPSNSLNPKTKISRILSAPLRLNTNFTETEIKQQIKIVLSLVELLPDYLEFYPHMLSPVQQHQVALARAMILNPNVILADEILATLDISLRFKIVNLLLKIQEKTDVSFIFVAHNMNLVRHMSDQVLVMNHGLIVENSSTDDIFNSPQTAISRHLLQNHQPDYRK